MNDYEWSERKLKIGVLLAMAIIGWFCLNKADDHRVQMNAGKVSASQEEIVRTPVPPPREPEI